VDQVYAVPELFNAPALALATFAFGWQIYCDFSGYTDMARGIARMMGFNLMLNFSNPYLATGLGDFWQRWHISLSTWFRDYVYIPLGGNRGSPTRTYANMFATMVISGVWHGAAWTFVIWGLLHALGRLLTRELERSRFYRQRVPRLAKQLGVFGFVSLAWVFFRAGSLGDAVTILTRMVTTPLTDPQFPALGYVLCFGLWGYQFAFESRWRRYLELGTVRVATAAGMVLYLVLFASSRAQAFIYFQF
jgi:D-alanyl-lipoteichoic acid acyltransferase DltB (MBOAT superfamily)